MHAEVQTFKQNHNKVFIQVEKIVHYYGNSERLMKIFIKSAHIFSFAKSPPPPPKPVGGITITKKQHMLLYILKFICQLFTTTYLDHFQAPANYHITTKSLLLKLKV